MLRNGNRLRLLKEIDALENGYCKDCDFKNPYHNKTNYVSEKLCTEYCNIGKRFLEIGKEFDASGKLRRERTARERLKHVEK